MSDSEHFQEGIPNLWGPSADGVLYPWKNTICLDPDACPLLYLKNEVASVMNTAVEKLDCNDTNKNPLFYVHDAIIFNIRRKAFFNTVGSENKN